MMSFSNISLVIIVLIVFNFHELSNADKLEEGVIQIPLLRQKTPLEQYLNSYFKKFGLFSSEWLHSHTPDLSLSKKGDNRTNDTVTLYRYLNHEFFGIINVGRPGQALNVGFDTTWTYSWFISSDCSALEEIGCYFHNKYDHHKSSNYTEDGRPFSIDDGSNSMKGYFSYDIVTVNHLNNTNLSFIEMVHVPKLMIFSKLDGVLGLGPKVDNYDPFFYKLYNLKKIKDPTFSVYFNRDTQSTRGGEIYLGFINTKHIKGGKDNINNITYLPVEADNYWQFQLDKIMMVYNPKKNFTYCANGCKAVIDTSSSTIIGPSAEVNKIHNEIQARKLLFNRYSVECERVNTLPKMVFTIAGKTYILTGPRYITKVTYKSISVCLSAFQPAEHPYEEERWFLGAAFLTEAYTVFKPLSKKIGFINAA